MGDGEEFLPEVFRSQRVFANQQRLQLALDELGSGQRRPSVPLAEANQAFVGMYLDDQLAHSFATSHRL
jgi:hypothetical protein